MTMMDAMLPYRAPRGAAPQAADRHVEGEVYDVAPAGMRFTVKSWDGGKHVFGPAPWPVRDPAPARGARCLVLFLGGGVDRPWILGVWG